MRTLISQASLFSSTRCFLFCFCLLIGGTGHSYGQSFDPSWISNGETYAKIGVLEDGMYQVTGAQLAGIGISITDIDPATLKMFENGRQIPVRIEGGTAAALQQDDAVIFAGRQNRGDDEAWAYGGDASRQGSTHFSLFSDTTWYWLTWDGDAGLRYVDTDPNQALTQSAPQRGGMSRPGSPKAA